MTVSVAERSSLDLELECFAPGKVWVVEMKDIGWIFKDADSSSVIPQPGSRFVSKSGMIVEESYPSRPTVSQRHGGFVTIFTLVITTEARNGTANNNHGKAVFEKWTTAMHPGAEPTKEVVTIEFRVLPASAD